MESLKGKWEKTPTEDINQLEVIIHEEWNNLNDLVIIHIACTFLKRVKHLYNVSDRKLYY